MTGIAGVPDTHLDLLRQPLVAALSTLEPDGQPQSTAVWYLLDDEELTVSVRTDRRKYQNMARDPRATLLLIDPTNTLRTLELRCRVELRPDVDKVHAQKFAPLYGFATSAWDPEGVERAIVRLVPQRVSVLG